MPIFDQVEMQPEDPILSLNSAFAADSRDTKVNLGVGAYKTAEGKPMVLSAVRKAEAQIFEERLNKEYLPIDGLPDFIKEGQKLVFGKDSDLLRDGKIYGTQSIGGSGALRIAGELLTLLNVKNVFFSNPTWPNHKGIFSKTGLKIDLYPYYDSLNHRLDFSGMCQAIKNLSPGDVMVLHACCHNPTGVDPTFEQWQELSELIKKRQVVPFFDSAYQGFKQGVQEDAQAIRYFAEQGHEMLVASSFSKNFGLYGERVGLLSIVSHHKETAAKIASQIKTIIRGNYSNPPSHGARIVTKILQSEALTEEWLKELANMRDRIKEMRKALIGELLSKKSHLDFSFLARQNGIFSFCGLDQDQVHRLRKENGIYMPGNGRVNIAGLNWQNLSYVVDSILAVL